MIILIFMEVCKSNVILKRSIRIWFFLLNSNNFLFNVGHIEFYIISDSQFDSSWEKLNDHLSSPDWLFITFCNKAATNEQKEQIIYKYEEVSLKMITILLFSTIQKSLFISRVLKNFHPASRFLNAITCTHMNITKKP